jgi:hypothetical protein
MRGRRPSASTAALIVVRATAGSALLLAPDRVLEVLPGHRTDRATRNVARVLGARDLIEAGLLWNRPSRRRVLIGVGVDITHVATMVALAVARPEDRAPSLSSALGALVLAAAGIAAAAHPGRGLPRRPRRPDSAPLIGPR